MNWRIPIGGERLKAALAHRYFLLILVTLLAAALRFYKLGAWSFWIDEIYTVRRAQSNFNLVAILGYWPPLSIILTGGTLRLLGVSEWTARLVPALIGVISIPVLYVPIRKMVGATTALLAVVLLAISPWHLFWSQNARFYASLLLLYTLALIAFYEAIEQDRPDILLASLALLFLASRERFTALFFVPIVGAYLVLLKVLPFEKPPGLRARNVGLLLVPAFAVGLIDATRYVVVGESYFLDSLVTFVGHPIDDPFRLLGFIASSIGVPLITFGSFGGLHLLVRQSRLGLFFSLAAAVPLLLLLAMSPFTFAKDRYVFVTLSAWILLAAAAAVQLLSQLNGPGKLWAMGVVCVLIADAAWANVQYYQINNGNRRDWKGAFALVQKARQPGDTVVSTRPELAAYYLGEEVPWMGDVSPDQVASSGKRYWFVLDSESVWVTGKIYPWLRQHGELIDVRYLRVPEDISLWTYLYDPARASGP